MQCRHTAATVSVFIFARTVLNVMTNIHDDVVPRLEGPDLGQDHEGSLQQPDQPPLVLQQGAHYAQLSVLEVS